MCFIKVQLYTYEKIGRHLAPDLVWVGRRHAYQSRRFPALLPEGLRHRPGTREF
jgi:hypothetical protein